jgi:hypothetical protein
MPSFKWHTVGTLVPSRRRETMEGDEPPTEYASTNGNPDRLEQILERLQKHYRDLDDAKRRVCVKIDLNRLDIAAADRRELLRRLG